MDSPYFTIVIPVHNREDRVIKTIDTVMNQAFGDFEVIVVDDGSTDNTANVVKQISDRRLRCITTENRERAAARNVGVSLAKGTYVTFLDSDDVVYPDHLATAYNVVADASMEVYHQGYEVVNEKGNVISAMDVQEACLNDLLFSRGNVMSCLGVFLRKDIALANPFDERRILTGVEDWELWIRLAAKYPIHHGSKVTAAVVQHSGRSVNDLDGDRWVKRMMFFQEVVEGNVEVRHKYLSQMPLLRSNVATYLSLHLSESPREKRRALQFLVQGIMHAPSMIFQRRTGSILRYVVVR